LSIAAIDFEKARTPLLRQCLEELGPRFALPEELVREDRSAEVAGLLADIDGLSERRVRGYAAKLSGRGVENLLFALLDGWVGRGTGKRASDGDATLHRLGTEKGLAWIRANPGRFAELAVIKFGRFWGTDRDIAWWVLEAPSSFYEKDWSPPGYAHTNIAPSARRAGTGLSTGVYVAILLAAAAGLWRHRRTLQSPGRGAWVAVMLIAALFTAVHMIVESQAKYHYTLVPLLCLLAGLAINPPTVNRAD